MEAEKRRHDRERPAHEDSPPVTAGSPSEGEREGRAYRRRGADRDDSEVQAGSEMDHVSTDEEQQDRRNARRDRCEREYRNEPVPHMRCVSARTGGT